MSVERGKVNRDDDEMVYTTAGVQRTERITDPVFRPIHNNNSFEEMVQNPKIKSYDGIKDFGEEPRKWRGAAHAHFYLINRLISVEENEAFVGIDSKGKKTFYEKVADKYGKESRALQVIVHNIQELASHGTDEHEKMLKESLKKNPNIKEVKAAFGTYKTTYDALKGKFETQNVIDPKLVQTYTLAFDNLIKVSTNEMITMKIADRYQLMLTIVARVAHGIYCGVRKNMNDLNFKRGSKTSTEKKKMEEIQKYLLRLVLLGEYLGGKNEKLPIKHRVAFELKGVHQSSLESPNMGVYGTFSSYAYRAYGTAMSVDKEIDVPTMATTLRCLEYSLDKLFVGITKTYTLNKKMWNHVLNRNRTYKIYGGKLTSSGTFYNNPITMSDIIRNPSTIAFEIMNNSQRTVSSVPSDVRRLLRMPPNQTGKSAMIAFEPFLKFVQLYNQLMEKGFLKNSQNWKKNTSPSTTVASLLFSIALLIRDCSSVEAEKKYGAKFASRNEIIPEECDGDKETSNVDAIVDDEQESRRCFTTNTPVSFLNALRASYYLSNKVHDAPGPERNTVWHPRNIFTTFNVLRRLIQITPSDNNIMDASEKGELADFFETTSMEKEQQLFMIKKRKDPDVVSKQKMYGCPEDPNDMKYRMSLNVDFTSSSVFKSLEGITSVDEFHTYFNVLKLSYFRISIVNFLYYVFSMYSLTCFKILHTKNNELDLIDPEMGKTLGKYIGTGALKKKLDMMNQLITKKDIPSGLSLSKYVAQFEINTAQRGSKRPVNPTDLDSTMKKRKDDADKIEALIGSAISVHHIRHIQRHCYHNIFDRNTDPNYVSLATGFHPLMCKHILKYYCDGESDNTSDDSDNTSDDER